MLYQEKSGNPVCKLLQFSQSGPNFSNFFSSLAIKNESLFSHLNYEVERGCQIFLGTKYQSEKI
jgi:hypothetical protein